MHGAPKRQMSDVAIRAFDVVAAALGGLLLLPLLLGTALAVRLTSPGPVLFRQERLGRHGRVFRIFKFRTMIDGAEGMGMGSITVGGDARITRVGRFLRDWSIDELPQLLNVLRGDMSLVGPRPALTRYLERYDDHQARRLAVPPGITGWAQVNGRNSLTWPQRIELDVWYVDHRSLRLNARIIARTIPVLFRRTGVYGPPENFEMSRQGHRDPAKPISRSVAG